MWCAGAMSSRKMKRSLVTLCTHTHTHTPVAPMRTRHVLVHLADGDVEVQVEGQNDTREQHHKHREGRVLEVGQLDLHGPAWCVDVCVCDLSV